MSEKPKPVDAWAAINELNIIFPHLVFIAKEQADDIVMIRSMHSNKWRVVPVTITAKEC